MGEIVPVRGSKNITLDAIELFVSTYIPSCLELFKKLTKGMLDFDIDTSFECLERRIRANFYLSSSGVNIALRILSEKIPTVDELKLPPSIVNLAKLKTGLVIVVGTTGSGKSTTLASIINIINHNEQVNIITIEEPIEYIYSSDKSRIEQREVGTHTKSFAEAARGAMRQDPDVLLIGELRDLTTISSALSLAETGHLVFCTLHAKSVTDTIDRAIDVFPHEGQEQIRVQLASVLKAVVHQKLVPSTGGGLTPLVELLIVDDIVSGMIRQKQQSNSLRDHLRSQKLNGNVHLADNVVWHCRNNQIKLESVKNFLSTDDYTIAKSILSSGRNNLLFGGGAVGN